MFQTAVSRLILAHLTAAILHPGSTPRSPTILHIQVAHLTAAILHPGSTPRSPTILHIQVAQLTAAILHPGSKPHTAILYSGSTLQPSYILVAQLFAVI